MGRRTRKQGGGGGGGSKLAFTSPSPSPSLSASASASVNASAKAEEDAIDSITYLLTLFRGGSLDEQVYKDLIEEKGNLTRILDRLSDLEDALNAQLQPLQARISAERESVKAPFTRKRASSFNNNNKANKQNANNELRKLNTSANAETIRRLRGEINGLYTKHGADIRKIESTYYQTTLKRLEPLVKLPQYCSDEERSRIGEARNNLFLTLSQPLSILYNPPVHQLILAYQRDLNP